MRFLRGMFATAMIVCFSIAATVAGLAQTPAAAEPAQAASPAPAASLTSSPAESTPAKKIYIVPAGTKVLLQLRSGINTRSAKAGDGVYLASIFPVVVGNKVMIPSGVYVQGIIDRVVRAGRVKGKSQLDMHFTSMIFPNGTVVEIPGLVNAYPCVVGQPGSGEDRGRGPTRCRLARRREGVPMAKPRQSKKPKQF